MANFPSVTVKRELDVSLVLPSTEGLEQLSAGELQARQREFAAAQRRVAGGAARVAAEIARRSAPELGHAGLAQKEGVRTPQQLIERLAGVSASEAHAMIHVGGLMATGSSAPAVAAVESGELSVLAADAIRTGLGTPSEAIDANALAEAEALLVVAAPDLSVRRLAAEARAMRDALDVEGVAEREEVLRERRYLRLTPQVDGMTRVAGLLDPESAAIVTAAFDQITAPRRGGPRFVDPAAQERAQAIVDDPRTTDQLLADAFVEMVRIAGAADTGRMFTQRRPAVQIHVKLVDLNTGAGAAQLEGQSSASSIGTARRMACSAGAIPVLFDNGDVLNLGRSQRLFTDQQRIALAARDGGCRFPGCDRLPSWCEAHHIDEWTRDNGRTDVSRGVLLCRFHHMNVHNNGWTITRRAGKFFAVPPPHTGKPDLEMPPRWQTAGA
ncbi:MAG TPA: DUF222 domain-containing protein [Pseudolysinimonas sp.]|nr:DUF222 domain-containing protein [Pseudolysinimonas sp.]